MNGSINKVEWDMLKKFELDYLTADLAAVDALLASRSEAQSPFSFFQYTCRKAALEEEVRRVSAHPDLHAELGIFFGGTPVMGARGINADFALKALDDLQSLIAEKYARTAAAPLEQSGHVAFNDMSSALLTDVVSGSTGFALEEAVDPTRTTATPLSLVVGELADIFAGIGAGEAAIVDKAVAALDQRLLVTMRRFFVRLDEHKATLRIVCGARDVSLNARAVTLARRRLQNTEIEEASAEYVGTVFLLPQSRQFELQTMVDSTAVTLSGIMADEAAAQFSIDARNVSQHRRTVVINTKVIKERNRPPRRVDCLVRVLEKTAMVLEA